MFVHLCMIKSSSPCSASLRVDTENNMNMAKSNLQATDCLQQEIVELEGRIAKAAESLKQEAIQQKAKETVCCIFLIF